MKLPNAVYSVLAGALLVALTSTPVMAKPPPPDTEAASNCARAYKTVYSYYVPTRKAPGQEEADGVQDGGVATDEVSAYVCMERKGRKVHMRYGWSSKGALHVAVFNFRLMDCATDESVDETVRVMDYERTELRAAHDMATFEFPKKRKLRPHLYGAGEYGRRPSYFLEGSAGRFNTYEEPKFIADGVCR